MTPYQSELYHHGVKGQKWGVRRFQNPDGSLTAAGKAHKSDNKSDSGSSEAKNNRAKKIAVAAGVLTLAAATSYVAANPNARKFVENAVKSMGKLAGEKTTALANKGKAYTKKAIQQSKIGLKEGIKEGFKEGPKKFAKAAIGGAFMYGGKLVLDKAVGKTNAGRIMKANDKKKIGSFWSFTEQEKKNDDDDDD